jgi:type II secretory pathway pseudopilin PulG
MINSRLGSGNHRSGFTIVETMAALGILSVVMIVVAQIGLWSAQDYARTFSRQAAQELAANVLEAARASPWDALTPEWARAQKLPAAFQQDGWRLAVRVDADPSRPLMKRVSVHVEPRPGEAQPQWSEELIGWFSARSAPASGGKP